MSKSRREADTGVEHYADSFAAWQFVHISSMVADFEVLTLSSGQKSIGRDRRDLLIGHCTYSYGEQGRGGIFIFSRRAQAREITSWCED
jgi:hypothetical protein